MNIQLSNNKNLSKRFILASDFDQTLSFDDTGVELSKILNINNFKEKIDGLSKQNFVQEGAELTYLLRHDPEFRKVRKEHLIEAGKNVRLKNNVGLLSEFLNSISDEYEFLFYVVSAGPKLAVQSALEGLVPAENIFGTEFEFADSGEIKGVKHSPAGYGKVTIIKQLLNKLNIAQNRIIYMGDGSSDIHVMLHINHLNGLTIAVSENSYIKEVAKRIVISDDVLSVSIPILENIFKKSPYEIVDIFEMHDLQIHGWDKLQTDTIEIAASSFGY